MEGPKAQKSKMLVGMPRVCYVVTEKLLCENSPYVGATVIIDLVEAGTGVSSLTHMEAEILEAIWKWMMSGMLATPKKFLGGAHSFVDERVNLLSLDHKPEFSQKLVM
jgi:hypothetical protein